MKNKNLKGRGFLALGGADKNVFLVVISGYQIRVEGVA